MGLALGLLVGPVCFCFGRWTRPAAAPARTVSTEVSSRIATAEPPRAQTNDRSELAKVTIENLGGVEFEHAYELLRSAPREALINWTRRLERLPQGPRRSAGIEAFFKTLAQIEARTAVDLALTMERHEPRWGAFGAIARATPASDLREVARMYTVLNEKKLSVGGLVHAWSLSDPVSTAEWIASYPGEIANDEIASLMSNWAAVDPAAARQWLATAGGHRHDPTVYAGLYSGWAEADPAAAFSDLAARGEDANFKKVIETVAEEVFKNSPDAARTFVSTLPTGAAQDAAVGAIVSDVTGIYLGGGPDLMADEVAKWLLTLPEHLWRENIGSVVNSWPDKDEAGQQTWINQLPQQTRDVVLAGYCRAYYPGRPTRNFQAGLRIVDRELREETLRKIFREMEEEPRQQLLKNLELSGEEARELGRILARL